MNGKFCRVAVREYQYSMNIRANECYSIGYREGNTDISIPYAYVKVVAQGKDAYAMGNSTTPDWNSPTRI